MRISTFFYTIKQGCINIFRNKWFTLASIATIGACLFLFGLFYAIIANFQNIVKTAQEGVSVTVFFDEGISQERIEEIGTLIDKRPEVSKKEFISADEAWEGFKEEYLGHHRHRHRRKHDKDCRLCVEERPQAHRAAFGAGNRPRHLGLRRVRQIHQ